jgi:hypothetical protein
MHYPAFIFTFLPAAVLAVLPPNITYPRHVLTKGRFTVPSGSRAAKPTVPLDAPQGVFTGLVSICTQPVITVTATVTCGGHPKSKPSLAGPAHDDDEHVSAKPSKSATVTWWNSTTTITGLAPWPVTATPTIDVITQTKGSDLITTTRYRMTTVYAETYSVSTATAKLNTTSVTGIVVNPALLDKTHHNPALLTETHYTDKTMTSTFVAFVTKTKIHAHTTVPAPSETDDDFSDEDASPSETRLPEHPHIPVPISIVNGSRVSHIASETKWTAYHASATDYPQDEDPGYCMPEYKDKDNWVEGDIHECDTYESDCGTSVFYDAEYDEDESEDSDEDVDHDVDETTSLKSSGTKYSSATATMKKPPKVVSTTTTRHGKPTSPPASKPAAKPKRTVSGYQSTAKAFSVITLSAPPTNGQWRTNATSAAATAKSSPKQPASATSFAHCQPDPLFTDLPGVPLSYSETHSAHSPLTSGPFSYKPIHHGHLSAASSLQATTEIHFPTPSATAAK